MPVFPRLAVGTVQPAADNAPLVWALMDALERTGWRVQSFLSRACFVGIEGATTITGQSPRHLDSWLMPQDVCRELFLRGSASGDVALVEGQFQPPRRAGQFEAPLDSVGGNLETLCRWLDLPRLATVDASHLSACQMPALPAQVDGVLLDRVADGGLSIALQTALESLWGVPILGCLGRVPDLRANMASLSAGSQPTRELCQRLGGELLKTLDVERVRRIAQREFAYKRPSACELPCDDGDLRIAVAYDEAFHCYFPDTLDMLELKGATVCDFSPLRDERLPPDTDLVYLGCGHPERFAQQLAENHCLMSALRNHARSGRRIYAEGGGMAYLCQHLETSEGQRLPMVGILPADARLNPHRAPPRPAEITLANPNWLGAAGTRLRGYANSRWLVEPHSGLRRYAAEPGHELDLIGANLAIGSRLHLNFAAQPWAMASFFEPFLPATAAAIAPLARTL